MRNFEIFHNRQRGTTTLDMVEESPVGVEGFAAWEPPEPDLKLWEDMYVYKDPYACDASSDSE